MSSSRMPVSSPATINWGFTLPATSSLASSRMSKGPGDRHRMDIPSPSNPFQQLHLICIDKTFLGNAFGGPRPSGREVS